MILMHLYKLIKSREKSSPTLLAEAAWGDLVEKVKFEL